MKRKKFLLVILFLLPVSCLSWFLEKPVFTPKEVSITRFSSGELHLLFGVEVQNPNNFDIKLRALEYTISINNQEMGKGRIDEEVVIAKSSTTMVRIPLQANFRNLAIPLGFVIAGKDLPYKIDGLAVIKARLGTASYPFSKTGEIKLKK